ncbi:MAG: hypothetical protein PIR02_16090 [Microbacterium enclense]
MLDPNREPTLLEIREWIRPGDTTWILRFDWDKNPMPMNGSRGRSWKVHAGKTNRIRVRAASIASLAQIPPLGRIEVQLTQWVTLRRTRDLDNFGLLEKPLYDALKIAGIVEDDKPELMTKHRPEIRHVSEAEGILHEACFTLRIAQLASEDVTE